MIYRLPCGKVLSVRKSMRAVRTVERNRYIENTPLGSPSGTALRLESTLYSVERLFPLLGGVSRGSVRVGVKTFLLPFYDFSFGYKRKGVNIKEYKRYHWSPIQPLRHASAIPLVASRRRFAPLPLTAHASAYAILAFADGGSRNSSLHPPPEALGISTLAQGSRDSLSVGAVRGGRSYARLRRAALIRLLFSDKPKTKSTFPKGKACTALALRTTLHREGEICRRIYYKSKLLFAEGENITYKKGGPP